MVGWDYRGDNAAANRRSRKAISYPYEKAAAEYERLKTIDPKNQIRCLIHPLYHYRLGRVYEEKGDKAKAAGEYRKFLEYWKDADKTHPELADAQKRLAAVGPHLP
jgi:tetratricopeptide (TPR) repeat protein